MLDYQRTIDNIRSILGSVGVIFPDAMEAAADEYAQACDAANERLRKCGKLLADGLRSEAIQQCEAEPNLLDLVATLDFPELHDWQMLLQSNGIQPPPPLLVDVAADLNEAYAQEQPMTAFLRRHRLLALRRAPLRDRIFTLRRLAELDAGNPIWKEDLREFERVRMQEIGRLAEAESRKGNVALVEQLASDLQSGEWQESPPPKLVQQVLQSHAKLVRNRAKAEMEQLEPQLNDAFSQFDVAKGRALRERWNTCALLCDLNSEDELYERALPALEWLQREDDSAADESAYQSAVSALEGALDSEMDRPELERLGHAVLRCERPIPPILEQRLRARISSLDLSRARRVRLIVAAVAAVLVLAVLGIGFGVMRQRHAMEVASHASTIDSLMDKQNFGEAQKHFDELAITAPAVAASKDIQQRKVMLTDAIRDEEKRQENFTSAIEAAEQASVEEPDRAALETAREMALSDGEKARVLALEDKVAAADRRLQTQRDNTFRERLSQIEVGIDKLDRARPDRGALAAFSKELADLITQTNGVTPAVTALAGVTHKRIDGMYQTMELQEKSEAAFSTITGAVGDPDRFKQALVDFAKEFPASSQAVDFERVSNEVGLWKEAEIWNQFIQQWNGQSFAPATAREMRTASEAILKDHAGYPAAELLRSKIIHLEAIGRRADESGALLFAPLNELFTDPLIAGLWMIEAVRGDEPPTRYYVIETPPAPKENRPLVRIKYIVDYSREPKQTKDLAEKDIRYRDRSPQSIAAQVSMDELAKMADDTWEATFFRIATTVQSSEKMDPILKVILLQKVLEVAIPGSESLRSSFAQFQTILNSVPIDPAVPWMDPLNEDAVRVRGLAAGVLSRLPALTDVGKSAAASLRAFREPLDKTHEWIGWIYRDRDQKWQCPIGGGQAADGELFVAVPIAGMTSLKWMSIGAIKTGVLQLDALKMSGQLQGRPVFLVR